MCARQGKIGLGVLTGSLKVRSESEKQGEKRIAYGGGSAVDVDERRVEAERGRRVQRHDREDLVDLPQAGLLKHKNKSPTGRSI